MNAMPFLPSRAAGLERLADFAPHAGRAYAAGRNSDPGPDAAGAVSRLSPYVRYRLVTEAELTAAALAQHGATAAEKFIQEVLWRTYWKGWLEMRPGVWTRFLAERDRLRDSFPAGRALAAAEAGSTGIDGFDDWARELVATGYLHNHARMWFASIWIFTLRLPWALGADFFLRHLIDADAASNTLSWRWVAGLQTPGKTYLATADNIERYTEGRFRPAGLAHTATALTEPPVEAPAPLPPAAACRLDAPVLLLLTHDDLSPETLFLAGAPVAATLVASDPALLWGDSARALVGAAAADTAARAAAHFGTSARVTDSLDGATLVTAAAAGGVRHIVAPWAPVGPVATALAQLSPVLAAQGITLVRVRRDWDDRFWPHAKKGFFPFKERIPALLREQGIA